jgi:hypothetical protein
MKCSIYCRLCAAELGVSDGGAGFADGGVCLRCAGRRVLELNSSLEGSSPAAPDGTLPAAGQVGPYEIIEEIGRGGMGRVYAARQIELGRIVALKVLREGSGGPDLRFLREIQTVARLRHPNIVAVHDSGRADGCVYFSMDYIEGGDLARRLRDRPIAPVEAAILMQKVAAALAYAHGQGVLHRDLKPSNILLDGDEPKLADFGLAAQLESDSGLTAATRLIGTPHYLAPEAIREGSGSLTVASEMYALGVMLFELLTGRTPFAGSSPAQLLALIESIDPPSPRMLAPAVAGDLETICLKCLDREPGRRYAGAQALADDLRRYLDGQPVEARPPSAFYRFRKFARRHRAGFLAAAAAGSVLIAATVISSGLAIRATRAERRAAAEAATSQEVRNFLEKDLLAQASPDQQPNRDILLRTVLDRAAKRIAGRFPDRPLVEASLRETMGQTYDSLGESTEVQVQLERARLLYERNLGRDDVHTLKVMDTLAAAYATNAAAPQGEVLEKETIARAARALGPDAAITIRAKCDLLYIYCAEGKYAEAEALGEPTLAAARKVLGTDDEATRAAMNNLASVYWSERKLALAEKLNRETVEVQTRVLGPEAPDTLSALSNLASIYWSEDDLARSEESNLKLLDIRKRVLGPEHRETLRSMNNLATTYRSEGRIAEAAALARSAMASRAKTLGTNHPDTLSSAQNVALIYADAHDWAKAEAIAAPTLAAYQKTLGMGHAGTLIATTTLALIWEGQQHLAEAEAILQRAWALRAGVSPLKNTAMWGLLDTLGEIELLQGKYGEAKRVLESSLAGHRAIFPEQWTTFCCEVLSGEALAGAGDRAEGERRLRHGIEGLKSRLEAARLPFEGRTALAAAQNNLAAVAAAAAPGAELRFVSVH